MLRFYFGFYGLARNGQVHIIYNKYMSACPQIFFKKMIHSMSSPHYTRVFRGRATDSYLPHLHRPFLRRDGPWWSRLSSNHRRKSPPTNCGLCPRSGCCCQPWRRRLTGAVIRHTQAWKWQWKSAVNTWQNGHRWKHAPQHGCMFSWRNMTAANVGATTQQLLVSVLLGIEAIGHFSELKQLAGWRNEAELIHIHGQ